ncbi:MAG: glycoside hydrolase family 2 TIM barrel-domain containing protein [Akkermansia sp.]
MKVPVIYTSRAAMLCCLLGCFFSFTHGEVKSISDSPYTVAGFTSVNQGVAPRNSFDINPGWRYYKGDATGAEKIDFNDRDWSLVNLPHGLELLPEEASGCRNYRGPAWYRKSVTVPESMKGKRVRLYFEGIMGKSQVWVNGQMLKDHLGGYLPVIVDVTEHVKYGAPNVIAVKSDNSNDPSFPPGKPQEMLDFCYFGGIYRDAYLLATNKVYITDANEANQVAGGGVFFRTESLDSAKKSAKTKVKVQVANDTKQDKKLMVHVSMTYPGDANPVSVSSPLILAPDSKNEVDLTLNLPKVRLWSPENPQLYTLMVHVYEKGAKQGAVKLIDSCQLPVGVRTFNLSDKGFVLNGKPYSGKLLGANRHQDFASLGNAVPNNLQWQDAYKLRDAGMKVIRCAHYPMDPAFMDACDKLGLFVIVTTPGWQFWGKDRFADYVYDNIRQMIRRDRNHPSVFMWEPILNESSYPEDFAKRAKDVVHEEYPDGTCYAACDLISRGSDYYDVIYAHPLQGSAHDNMGQSAEARGKGRAVFTREYGDYVDDWSSHNSPSRVSRNWGEIPMLLQGKHYTQPEYKTTCVDALNKAGIAHFGGCLWHSFDHQRGYHPDPFYGGIFDAYRQPKTSFYLYKAQRPVSGDGESIPGKGPFIYIANACTPFSPEDVTVYTNCDFVRLKINGKTSVVKKVEREKPGMPNPPVIFPKAWNFTNNKNMTRDNQSGQVALVAEGIINGKVVTTTQVKPARRADEIRLTMDTCGVTPQANGSDVALIIASVTDRDGNVKRLNNEQIFFEVEGPAEIIGEASNDANPKRVQWGTAPVLVRMGTEAGKIRVKASVAHKGQNAPAAGTLEFTSIPASQPLLGDEKRTMNVKEEKPKSIPSATSSHTQEQLEKEIGKLRREVNDLRSKEVSRQQTDFE